MKTTKFAIIALTVAFSVAVIQAEEKTVGEKSAEAWDKTKQKTKEVGSAVAKKTKETVAAVEHKIDQPDADARKVNVQVSDRGVQMPKSLPAGKTAFIVKNTGKQKHNFDIEGEHLDKSFWFGIAPNATKTMQVNLKPGTYEADCNVSGHEGKEAKVQLKVK
ncbi:MAG: cupredoxin domain-containing protein [Chthoniobacterales bacterium]